MRAMEEKRQELSSGTTRCTRKLPSAVATCTGPPPPAACGVGAGAEGCGGADVDCGGGGCAAGAERMIWSPERRPRLETGSSATRCRSRGGYPAFTAIQIKSFDVQPINETGTDGVAGMRRCLSGLRSSAADARP